MHYSDFYMLELLLKQFLLTANEYFIMGIEMMAFSSNLEQTSFSIGLCETMIWHLHLM